MSRQLLRWCCIWAALLACGTSVHAATFFVGPKKIGLPYYWNPTNVTIMVGDTVMWTNLGNNVHSLEPSPTNSPEQFCGTGTNLIPSCTVTFLTPGKFFYDCYQHLPSMTGSVTVLAPPTVAITNPVHNALFPTHADVTIRASATDADGSVTNVQFLRDGIPIATSTVAPYSLTLSNVAPGYYNLRALATDNSALVTTSALVTVRVAAPPVLQLTNSPNGPLRFTFNSITGVNYVVEGSAALPAFSPIITNAGTNGPLQFSQTNPAPAQNFFRVRLQ
jgi:plastocyanin